MTFRPLAIRLALLLVGLGWLALAHPQAQTAPVIQWTHAGTNVTHFQIVIGTTGTWVVDAGLPTPSGTTYEYALPALPAGTWPIKVRACYGADCQDSAAMTVVKMVAAGSTALNYYWVDDDGAAASWAACKSDTPLSGAAACTLAVAATNAAAGDTVWLRGGTYAYSTPAGQMLNPANAGTLGARITFAAHPNETPVLESTATITAYAVYIDTDYVVVRGLTIHNFAEGVHVVGGDYNEVRGCTIYRDAEYSNLVLTGAVLPIYLDTASSHNWIVGNTIHTFGSQEAEGGDGFRIGHSGDNSVHHNTFQQNVAYHFGHTVMDDYGTSNVWLNNTVHNEGWKTLGLAADLIYGTATGGSSGVLIDTGTNFVTAGVVVGMLLHTTGVASSAAYAVGVVDAITTTTNTNDTVAFSKDAFWLPVFTTGTGYVFTAATVPNAPDAPGHLPGDGKYGHRNFSLSNDSGTDTAKYVVLEGNRIGHASINYANRGAEGISLGSPGNLIRYNAIFGSDASGIGIKSYTGASHYGDNNRIYANTFYKNGQAAVSATSDFKCVAVSDLYGYANYYSNNLLYGNGTSMCATWGDMSGATGTFSANRCAATNAAYGCTATADPQFVAPTMTAPTSLTLPDLRLQAASPVVDQGGALTTADGAGDATATLVVVDAMMFQDGTRGSSLSQGTTVFPDWVAVGTVDNVAQISSINYDTNTITLASALSWSNGASVWLYKKADGVRVLYGTAPDAGAHEYGVGSAVAPTGVVVR